MKYWFLIFSGLALASAPAYSHISEMFERSGTLIAAFAPGAETLFNEEQYEPAIIALAEK